jgi:release factor glutamine methyltransferase
MLERLQKKYTNTFLKPYLTWYLKRERTTNLKGFTLTIKPSVFHPKYFFSSLYLFDFVSKLNLDKKQFLEIGCGSGIISLLAYRKEALVTACDLNPLAVDCAKINFEKNFKSPTDDFQVIESDVFDRIPEKKYDVIVINPPYFFKEVTSQNELAWNCGKNGEYFSKLFSQLNDFSNSSTEIYMILADNCDIEKIKNIATQHNYTLKLIEQKKIKWEVNYMFKILV